MGALVWFFFFFWEIKNSAVCLLCRCHTWGKHGTRLHACPNCFYFILNIGHGWGIVGSRGIPKKERKKKVCNLASLFSIFNLPHASLVSVSPTWCLFIFLNSLSHFFVLKNLPFYNIKKVACLIFLFIRVVVICLFFLNLTFTWSVVSHLKYLLFFLN